jgi:hypothetical protein
MYLSICLELTFSGPPLGDSIEGNKSPHMGSRSVNARKRFRSVLRLNILLATVNGDGHPTLQWDASAPPKKRERKSEYDLLKYITVILVRNSEVVAAVAHETRRSSLSATSFSPPPTYQVNVIRTEHPVNCLEEDELVSRTDHGNAFTAVANPYTPRGSDKDPYFETEPPDVNCLIVPGISHLSTSDTGEASFLESILKIP